MAAKLTDPERRELLAYFNKLATMWNGYAGRDLLDTDLAELRGIAAEAKRLARFTEIFPEDYTCSVNVYDTPVQFPQVSLTQHVNRKPK